MYGHDAEFWGPSTIRRPSWRGKRLCGCPGWSSGRFVCRSAGTWSAAPCRSTVACARRGPPSSGRCGRSRRTRKSLDGGPPARRCDWDDVRSRSSCGASCRRRPGRPAIERTSSSASTAAADDSPAASRASRRLPGPSCWRHWPPIVCGRCSARRPLRRRWPALRSRLRICCCGISCDDLCPTLRSPDCH